jgi:hypothetical protein
MAACFRNAVYILRINKQQDTSSIQNFILPRNSTCFGHLLCPSSGVICIHGSWYVSCRLCCSNLTLLAAATWPAWNIPIATCTADKSWRWAQKIPETCRVSWQNKILDAWCILLVMYTKIITMHGHLNIKYCVYFSSCFFWLRRSSYFAAVSKHTLKICNFQGGQSDFSEHIKHLLLSRRSVWLQSDPDSGCKDTTRR